jgi:hypothetical protein
LRLAALAKSEKRAEEVLRQAAAALENAPKPGLICPFPRPVPSENLIHWIRSRKENRIMIETDGDLLRLLLGYMRDCFRSHERLKAEILILRHQLNILHRKAAAQHDLPIVFVVMRNDA